MKLRTGPKSDALRELSFDELVFACGGSGFDLAPMVNDGGTGQKTSSTTAYYD